MVSIEGAAGGLVIAGLGTVVAWNGWTAYDDEQQAVDNAVEVQAEVTDIRVTEHEERVDIEDGGTRTRTRYAPQLSFEYDFEGETYTAGNRHPPAGGVDAIPRYGSESQAREALASYTVGETVTAHVNPANPGEGFLERGTNTVRNLGLVAVGGIVSAAGLAFLIGSVVVLTTGGLALVWELLGY